jgi:hypothetical protein
VRAIGFAYPTGPIPVGTGGELTCGVAFAHWKSEREASFRSCVSSQAERPAPRTRSRSSRAGGSLPVATPHSNGCRRLLVGTRKSGLPFLLRIERVRVALGTGVETLGRASWTWQAAGALNT